MKQWCENSSPMGGARVGTVYGKNGKASLREKIAGYNNAAPYRPWIVLVDLDLDADCAPSVRQAWLPQAAPYMCFRIAVREVEAWLMADAASLARYLRGGRFRRSHIRYREQESKW